MNKNQNNQWHLSDYPDNILKVGYSEWKYFNFIAPEYSGFFVYLAFDPLNITGIGGARVLGRIFAKDKVFGASKKFSMPDVNFSESSADMSVKGNYIKVKKGSYKIKGKVDSIEWDLKYSPFFSKDYRLFRKTRFMPYTRDSFWFIEMPKAKVAGHIKIKDKKIKIKASGYSDGNWGSPFPIFPPFSWSQYSDKDISVVMGDIRNFEIGKKKIGRWGEIYVIYKNEKIIFEKKDFKVENLKWEYVAKTKIKVPAIVLVEGENKDYKISLILRARVSDPLHLKMPFSFPVKPVVVEQTALFRGDLFKKEKGKLIPLHFINGEGFKEHTLRRINFSGKPKAGILV